MPADLLLRTSVPPHRSRIRIAPGALDRLGAFVRRTTVASRVVVVSDTRVARLYGARARRALARARLAPAMVTITPGERSKRPRTLERLWDAFARSGLGRADAVVALGGGVVGDLAGFAAASWLRGVAWVGVPTTVMAQVDSGVGGKTGVDLACGKNLVGAFHHPAGVLVDPEVLGTLSARDRRAGLAEVVKTGMALDRALFRWVEREAEALSRGDPAALGHAVRHSIRVKARVVGRDPRERERGPRTALNLGHTLGHAIEAARGYRGLRHGEAVAIGLRVAAALSESVAGLPARDRERLDAVLDRLALPRRMPPTPLARLLAAMARDKKRARAGVRWVLTPRVGHASVPRLISGRFVRSALLAAGARP